jgi:hypothetical protein
MGETQRLKRSPEKSHSSRADHSEADAPARANAPPSPASAWAGGPVGAPFALGGGAVQRKVAIGASNDVYERQADHVANRVAGGGTVPQGSISPIAPATASSVGQREAKPDDKKKNEKPAAPVQREARSEDTKKDPKSAGAQLQRQAKPEEKKKDEKPASAPVQKQAKPDEKKKDEKPAAAPVQKQSKPDEKKEDERPASAPVQKQAKPDEQKKDEKPAAAPVQKQSKPDEKKKDEKSASAPVQKQTKPDEKKKDEKPAAAPVQKQAKPDEKKKDEKPASAPVQKQAKPDDKKKDEKTAASVQREVKPEDKKKEEVPGTLPAQRAEKEEPAKEESGSLQASSAGGVAAATPSMESVASQAVANKGPGEPLQPATRGTLESRIGTDLSDVRVHNDDAAQSAADALNARAFTHENDIWLGRGESQSDTRLMAHEATHVMQQTGSVHRQLVQRAKDKPADDSSDDKKKDKGPKVPTEPVGDPETGRLDPTTKPKEIQFNSLDVPEFKASRYGGKTLKRQANYKRNDPDPKQRSKWKENIKTDKAVEKLKAKAKKAQAKTEPEYVFTAKTKYGSEQIFFGAPEAIAREMTLASWDPHGEGHSYDVDHILELQLANWSEDKSGNELDNMELLDSPINQKSGGEIERNIEKKLEAFIKKEGKDYGTVTTLKRDYTLVFKNAKGTGGAIKPEQHWTREQIEDKAEHIGEPGKGPVKISDPSVLGKKGEAKVFPSAAGGQAKTFHWPGKVTSEEAGWFKGFQLTAKDFDTKDAQNPNFGSLTFEIPKSSKLLQPSQQNIPVQRVPGAQYAGYINKKSVMDMFRNIRAKGLSPIETDELEINEKGLLLTGRITPEISLLKGTSINFEISGNDIRVFKTFDIGDFKVPKPLTVSDASFTISAGLESGLKAEGEIHFGIDRVGTGSLKAGGSISEGLEISGSFDFDSKTFQPAKVEMEYKKEQLSIHGHLGIPEGKVTGVKHADITVDYAAGKLTATGSADLTIPGVQKGTVEATYSEADGFAIGGSFLLSDKIPGISGGSIDVKVAEKGGKYSVAARGEATPKIPGISSKLIVSYDDGAFDASITAGYEKGMLKGSVTVGATNRPVGDDGKPAGPPPEKAEKVTIYGGGSVSLKLAPWLQATAAIKFLSNGEVQVTGKIGLPSVLNIFDEKKVSKNIFKIGIDIPILGFSVLGHNVGIFLEIGGGLDLDAGIGPGQLQDVELSVTYNPAHEEDTLVHGHAALHIPAHAGLRLFVSAALGAGIPLVDAKAGIELGGSLGIEGALHAAVDVDWSPKRGLVLDANAEVYAEPKFKFDITGFVLVELDLLFTTKTLYEKKWQLAAVEYGSGLRLGMKLPIHYEEGKPFNISLSDIQFEVPHIDAMSTIKGLFDKII